MTLTLFHTAQVHCTRFDALRDAISPDARMTHIVRPDWLSRAQKGIGADLAAEISDAVAAVPRSLCTCTTIAAVAEQAGAVRIDRPMMQIAAEVGGKVCLAYCLHSTAQSSTDLLAECVANAGTAIEITACDLSAAWPLFEAGQLADFAAAVAQGVRIHLQSHPDTKTVVLAQASMDGAVDLLRDCPATVLASPRTAFEALMEQG